jgi:hypothetical protein
MALVLTQPQIEMITRKSFGGKARPARMADSVTSFCEPFAKKM